MRIILTPPFRGLSVNSLLSGANALRRQASKRSATRTRSRLSRLFEEQALEWIILMGLRQSRLVACDFVMSAQEACKRFRVVRADQFPQWPPNFVMASFGTGQQDIVDVNRHEHTHIWKPKGRWVVRDGHTADLRDSILEVLLPMASGLWMSVQCSLE